MKPLTDRNDEESFKYRQECGLLSVARRNVFVFIPHGARKCLKFSSHVQGSLVK